MTVPSKHKHVSWFQSRLYIRLDSQHTLQCRQMSSFFAMDSSSYDVTDTVMEQSSLPNIDCANKF